MMKTSMSKPDLLKKQESQVLSNAAALLLAGVDHQRKQSDKEIEVNLHHHHEYHQSQNCVALLSIYDGSNGSLKCHGSLSLLMVQIS